MLKKRWFFLFLALSLVGLVAFTGNPSQVTSKIVFGVDPPLLKVIPEVQQVAPSFGEYCPFNAQELHSLHTVTIMGTHETILATVDGPVGFDGGTFALSQCRMSK
jgi:hypothetical protein